VLVWLLWNLRTYTPQAGVWIRQKLNAGPPPRNVTRDLNWLIVLIVWVFIPAVWLPIASTVAAAGFRLKCMTRSLRVLRRPAYWLWFCALMLVGTYVPYKLVWWIPDLSDLRKQAWSMGLRFLLAYVILITAWVALLLVIGARVEKEDSEPIVLRPDSKAIVDSAIPEEQ
jgi:heme/copper-type cytochrome/quinol oxidase subunit 2